MEVKNVESPRNKEALVWGTTSSRWGHKVHTHQTRGHKSKARIYRIQTTKQLQDAGADIFGINALNLDTT